MNFKLKPLSVAVMTTAALAGCGDIVTEEEKIEKTFVVEEGGKVDPNTGFILTAPSGLTCKSPDIVQSINEDFHPLSSQEQMDLKAAAMAIADPDSAWTDQEVAAWEASFDPYTFDYGTLDMYSVLGLTLEEQARKAIAKEEARAFKVSQGQDVIFNAEGAFEGGFDAWFDAWFETVSPSDYLGKSQRLQKAARGAEIALSAADNGDEVCYTPPTDCPNYQVVDESGTYDCIVPEENPIEGAPAPVYTAAANEAVIYYRKNGEQNEANYTGMTIHTWNNSNCTSYNEDTSTTNWGSGKAAAGIDPNYGMYWVLDLIDGHDNCGNMIVYEKTSGSKAITDNDAMIPLGNSGDVIFHNLDKMSYFQDGFQANVLDGVYLANQHPYFGAAAAGNKACGWGTSLDDAGESCVGQAIDSCPTGTYAVGVGQVDIASKCIPEYDTDETTLYLRGGFNDWANPVEGHEFEYTGDGQYRKHLVYGAHPDGSTLNEDGSVSYFFKVADADWSEASTYGGVKGGDVPAVGGEISVTAGNGVGQDMAVSLEANTIYEFNFDADPVSDAKLEILKVPVAAYPAITVGSEDPVLLQYTGDNTYLYQVELEASTTITFTIADADNSFAVGASTGANTATLDTKLALVNDGGSVSFTSESDKTYVYNMLLDLTDTAAPMLLIEKAAPLGLEDAYLRGNMTGWGDVQPGEKFSYDKASRTYTMVYGLEAVSGDTSHAFKIADSGWSGAIDVGTGNVTYSDAADALELSGDGNINVKPTKSTTYEFSLSFAESSTGVLKVSEAPVYIRGGIYGTGDWGTDETMRLNFEPSSADNATEGGATFSSVVTTTGTGFFKVADADWGSINYGASAEQETAGTNVIVLGTPLKLTAGGDSKNISFQEPAGTYRFSFNNETKEITVTEVE